jgi:hypothetical protein
VPLCNDKADLIGKILEVHKRIASIHIELSDALLKNRTQADGVSLVDLDRARDLRRNLMEELTRHVGSHGC